jgi:hypothetical protein
MHFTKKIAFLIFLLISQNVLIAQNIATIKGYIKDDSGNSVPDANIIVLETKESGKSNKDGYYKMNVSAEKNITLQVSFSGYEKFNRTLFLKNAEKKTINIILKEITLDDIEIKADKRNEESAIQINALDVEKIVNPSGDIGNIIKTLPGVASNNELSGQYNVRGGNFDENLVYINDFPIYRPFIVRNAQQEGLSVPNIDLIKSIQFSAGGFESKYGDKLSSVLDITYKKTKHIQSLIWRRFYGN